MCREDLWSFVSLNPVGRSVGRLSIPGGSLSVPGREVAQETPDAVGRSRMSWVRLPLITLSGGPGGVGIVDTDSDRR